MITAIRLCLTLIMIYFVWEETGIATTTAIGLIMLNSELVAYSIRRINKAITPT